MVLQFGSIASALLVLVAVPLGFLGVIASLWIFKSSLSLNSALGVILLNGIAVANSILLVDFIRRGIAAGKRPLEAALDAGRSRLRPILITSLTTILAMIPVALGLGEGGRILQPLGIAVAGGLWVSTLLTLFIVPALQVLWLQRKRRRTEVRELGPVLAVFGGLILFSHFASAAPTHVLSGTLDLVRAVDVIVRRDPSVVAKRETLESVEWSSIGKRAVFLPSLSLSGSRATGSSNSYSLGWSAELNLFRFGADYFQWRQADREVDSAQSSLETTLLSQEQVALESVVLWIEKNREREITQTVLELQKKSLEISRARFQRGMIPIQEVEKIEVDVSQAEILLMDLDILIARAKADLVQALGSVKAVETLDRQWVFDRISPVAQVALSSSLSELALPSFNAAVATLEAQQARQSRTERLLLPSLSVVSNTTFLGYLPTSSLDGTTWSLGLQASWPIFDQLVRYTDYRTQVHTVGQAEASLEQTRRAVYVAWETARERFRISMNSLALREKSLKLSRKLYEDGVRRFQAGRVSANELFVEHRRWLDGELLYLRAMGEIHRSFSEYCHAMGKTLNSCLTQVDKSVRDEYR
jgi:outer membrane protein TolC